MSRWVKKSLADGHEISAAVLADLRLDEGTFQAVLPADFDGREVANLERGGVMAGAEADRDLAAVLDELAGEGSACVVVEDDMGMRMDPAIQNSSLPVAFMGDRVISWAELERGRGADAVEAITQGASGYPRNAFVVSKSVAELELVDRQSLSQDFAGKVADALLAVIVGAFDDESYVLWVSS